MEQLTTLRTTGEAGAVEVRLRHVMEADATALLGFFPLIDLQRVIEQLGRWGVSVDGETSIETNLSGQFVLGNGETYFEIVVDVGSDE